jgi:REP element-mobilizing transposase RayT
MVFHVVNRAIAHRPAFERRADVRYFLALLARSTRRWGLEIQAYTVLTTHFHVLLRSMKSELAQAMAWIEQRYTARFNRTHDRDGPLFRGRYVARHVDTREYWFAAVRYIDRNAVAAGLARTPQEYPYGSACRYAHQVGPRWLARSEIEETVCQLHRAREYRPELYLQVFREPLEAETWLVERHLQTERTPGLRLVDLLAQAPPPVRAWLEANARNADGILTQRLHAAPRAALAAAIRGDVDVMLLLRVGLLRDCCGLSQDHVARILGVSASTVRRREARHRERLRNDAGYGHSFGRVVADACLTPIRSTCPPS